MIQPILFNSLKQVTELLRTHDVKSAFAFGSVCTDKFSDESDIDLLIDFNTKLNPLEKGEKWWELHYALKKLLNRDIDLVTAESLQNPFFIEKVNSTKQIIYVD